jgi:hypothetical protein
MAVSREDLYKEVWAEPMTTVAARYEVSSSFLARVCQRLNVPRPPRGYWAQRAVGIKLKQSPLPAPAPGQELEWVRDGDAPRREPIAGGTGRKKGRGDRPSVHPLLAGAKAHFDHARDPGYHDEEYVRPYKRYIVDLYVSKEMLDAALTAASQLFLALEDRGHRVVLAPPQERYLHKGCVHREGYEPSGRHDHYGSPQWTPGVATLVFVGHTAYGLTLFEISEEAETRWDETLRKSVRRFPREMSKKIAERISSLAGNTGYVSKSWFPSGRLGLHAYCPRNDIEWEHYWYESKPGELVSRAREISGDLLRAVEQIRKLQEESDRKAEEWRRKCEAEHREFKRREAERLRVEEEKRRVEDIEQRIDGFRFARDIREYVAEIRRLVGEASLNIIQGGSLDEFIDWALAYADDVDPLTALREEIQKALKRKGEPKAQDAHASGAEGGGERDGDPGDTRSD